MLPTHFPLRTSWNPEHVASPYCSGKFHVMSIPPEWIAASRGRVGPGGAAVHTLISFENSLATIQLTLGPSVGYAIFSPLKAWTMTL